VAISNWFLRLQCYIYVVQGSDSVIACLYDQKKGRVDIEASWNTGSPKRNRAIPNVRFIYTITVAHPEFWIRGGRRHWPIAPPALFSRYCLHAPCLSPKIQLGTGKPPPMGPGEACLPNVFFSPFQDWLGHCSMVFCRDDVAVNESVCRAYRKC